MRNGFWASQNFQNVQCQPNTVCTAFDITFYNCIVPMGFHRWEIRGALPGENQQRQSRAAPPTVHAGYFSSSRIHRTLTLKTTWSLTCTQIAVNACDCTRGCTDTLRESALKGGSGRNIPCRTGESNLRQRRDGPMLYQLSYTSSHVKCVTYKMSENY